MRVLKEYQDLFGTIHENKEDALRGDREYKKMLKCKHELTEVREYIEFKSRPWASCTDYELRCSKCVFFTRHSFLEANTSSYLAPFLKGIKDEDVMRVIGKRTGRHSMWQM
jgi:hypothetical protein